MGVIDIHGHDEARSRRVLARLAPTVRDHKHLEALLTSAPPELRQTIYDTLKPNLLFQAKPLDVYVASAGQRAEREQWPVLDSAGNLLPFKPASDVKSIEKSAEKMMAATLAKNTLTLTCKKCTRRDAYHEVGDETHLAVLIRARGEGWRYDSVAGTESCPDCSASLRPDV